MRRLLLLAVAPLAFALLPAAASPAAARHLELSTPAWSAGGTKIAWSQSPFSRGPQHSNPPTQIWTANADGSGAAPLIGGLIVSVDQIVWPISQELLYDANQNVWLASPDGEHKLLLRSTGSTFSTDATGTRIASAPDFGGPIDMAVVASGKSSAIHGAKGTLSFDPTLSPDGRRVAFNRGPDPNIQNVSRDGLYVAQANGKVMHRILGHGYCASWSPQGNEIAFLTINANAVTSLNLVHPDGSHARVLVKGGGSCSVPHSMAWSPNDKWIAYVNSSSDHLVVVEVASGRRTTVGAVASVTGLAWSPDSTQLLVTARTTRTACSSLWTVGAGGKGARLVRNC